MSSKYLHVCSLASYPGFLRGRGEPGNDRMCMRKSDHENMVNEICPYIKKHLADIMSADYEHKHIVMSNCVL